MVLKELSACMGESHKCATALVQFCIVIAAPIRVLSERNDLLH